MPSWPVPWTPLCPEVSTYRRPLRSPSRAIFDGVEKDDEDIFPDPMSESMADSWRSGAVKALERQNAALVNAEPVKS